MSENADSSVHRDLETIMARLAPDGDPAFEHDYEGDDDMAAHVRSVLTTNDISIPVANGNSCSGPGRAYIFGSTVTGLTHADAWLPFMAIGEGKWQ